MSVVCVREMLRALCTPETPRIGLKQVERVLDINLREDGLSAWFRHGLEVERAIPKEHLEQLCDEKWENFRAVRYPQLVEQIKEKRDRYLSVMKRIEERNANQTLESIPERRDNLDLEL
jgi:hypothetical protein